MTGLDLDLVVEAVEVVAAGIRSVALRRADGGILPGYVPGSHLTIGCGELRNAYSLTGSGRLPERYTISVLLRRDGRGGSRWVHGLEPGRSVQASLPRSAFPPVVTARHHLMIAGGIGITPFLSHLAAARQWGRSVTLLYGVSGDGPVPHGRALEALTDGQVEIVRGRAALGERRDILLRSQPLGTHLYVCGPQGLMDDTLERAQALGWPAARCHLERFGGVALDEGEPFRVHLRRSNRDLAVAAGVSLLEALEADGIAWPSMCREGVCGECRMEGAAGAILHRDLVLSRDERAAGTCLMPCVSRAEGLLVLDL